jgi:predicted transcriptional regulator of viral defense system
MLMIRNVQFLHQKTGHFYYLYKKNITMKVSETVENTINKFSFGYVFTYNDFNIGVACKEAAIKHLNRMVLSGKLVKLSKGKYYKPEQSKFGQIPASEYQIVKDLLEQDGRIIGYITGFRAYNELGLTTQVPNTIQIGTNKLKNPTKRGLYKIMFVTQNNNINKESIPLLRMLDAIKDIKKIPDAMIDDSISIMADHISKLSKEELQNIKRLSIKYTPVTRALLGAIIEMIYSIENTQPLYTSLNHITKYKLGASLAALPTKEKWNII